MQDHYGRTIDYLRLSVTDLCNLRCRYCMPEHGVPKLTHRDILSVDEVIAMAEAAVACGVKKIRLTGGEPLVRRGILDICRGISALPGLKELCMTTNALLLDGMAEELHAAGVSRLNISLDTLRPERFSYITRVGSLDQVFAGIKASKAAGFTDLKLNTVLIGGFNDDEIADFVALTQEHDVQVRFIELMPIGECAAWDSDRFLPADAVLKAVPALAPVGTGGVAQLYRLPGGKGAVGLIRPISDHFCPSCNRIRITADGRLKTCLHSSQEIPLRGLSPEALRQTIAQAIGQKPERHHLDEAYSESLRNMNEIGG